MNITKTKAVRPRSFEVIYAVTLLILSAFWVQNAYAAPVLPEFNTEDFSQPTVIANKWLALPIGSEFEYEGETEDGTETIEINITGDTKKVMGVTTLVYRDRVYLDGELIEDTRDYLAQDDEGNIWYFGEDVDNYEDGKISDHNGSWLAGKDGALPGYWLPADPAVGYEYRQEYYEGEAEDVAKVVSRSATVKVNGETYTNCLKTEDTNLLELDSLEYKYYCTQVHVLVLEENPVNNGRVELVEIEYSDNDDSVDSSHSVDSALVARLQMLIMLITQLLARMGM